MGIQSDDITKVRESADLVALIAEHTEIKRSGRSWMARCPMHGERTPSLSVSPEKGVYYCFGCHRSGDAISFVQEMDNLDFVGAVESLASRAGITLHYTKSDEGAVRARKRKLTDAVGKAVEFYHQRLMSSSDGGEARGYLRSRGYGADIVKKYQIGWAPDDWDQLARHLRLSPDDLRDSGLGFVNKAGRQQDAFRGRVMFPIFDERGDPVGFGGRILPGHEGSKYKNTTTDAVVYDKSRVLYGLHNHREGIVHAGEAIICEGYTDVIGFAEAGIERAVATCGTALTEQHVKLLKRFSADRLVLSFDADAAGLAAADRVYAWEQEFGLDVRVADLPPGVDPADLAREDPAELQRAVTEAIRFLKFRVDRVLSAADLTSAEGRAHAAQAAVGVVVEHPDALVRDQYLMEIADRCRIEIRQLREIAAAPPPPKQPVAAGDSRTERTEPHHDHPDSNEREAANSHDEYGQSGFDRPVSTRLTAEDEVLRVAIHRPDDIAGKITPALFHDPVRREAFEALADGGVVAASDRAGPAAAGLLRRLAVDPSDAETGDVLAGIARLAADRVLRELQRDARGAASIQDRQGYASAIGWVKMQTENLAERDSREPALAQLLPWLIAQLEGRES